MKTWKEQVKAAYLKYEDEPTFIKVYSKNDLYIVHGEIFIYCFNKKMQKLWDFSARDIWATPDGTSALTLYDEYIELRDWLGYVYKINYQGKEIRDHE